MKNILNILFVTVLSAVLMVSCNKDQNFSTVNGKPQIEKSIFTVIAELIFGTRSHPDCCTGCEGDKGICFRAKAEVETGSIRPLISGEGYAEVLYNPSDSLKLMIDIKEDNGNPVLSDPNNFYVLEDKELENLGPFLGCSQVFAKEGIYPIDYTTNPLGVIVIDIEKIY